MQPSEINGVVLIGGRSRRMGSDKYNLAFKGQKLLAKAIAHLEASHLATFISCAANQIIADAYNKPVIIDEWPDQGPLSGIYSALSQLKTAIFVLAIDYPLLTQHSIDRLLESRDINKDATIYFEENSREWPCLCAIIEFSALPKLESFFESGQRSVRKFYATLNVHTLDFDRHEFFNMNTAADYQRLLKGL